MKAANTVLKTLATAAAALGAMGLQAADRFNPEPPAQPLGAIAPIELSTTDLSNGAKAYRPWFENGGWQGDLVEYDVSSSGKLTTSIELIGTSPAQTDGGANWSAHVQFAAAEANNADWWQTRKIITAADGSQVNFTWLNLTAAQREALDLTAFNEGKTTSDILNFVRGDRSKEHPFGSLRARYSVLGDIVHSNPTYAGPPSESLVESGYAAFAASKSGRKPRVYVGANDGMLHVFDAATGNEVYAYIPSMIVGNLDKLAGRPYSHLFGVDGQITVKDAKAGGWKTVLVGGLGAGGKGWYALDVTSDALTSGTLMWELDAGSDDDMGYSYGQAVITRLNDGNWYAVFGNGYSSVNGQAMLYLVKLSNGEVKKIAVGAASAGSPNGLSSPSLVDSNGDGKADIAYAGDIDGNLWKFDLTSSSTGDWDDAYNGKPLHEGVPERPIINAPDVTRHPQRGFLVFFGTGKLFTKADITDTTVQAIYGIWDLRGSTPPSAINQKLQAQTLSGDLTYTSGDISVIVRTFTPDPGAIDWSSQDGWVVELPAGFKVLTPVTLRGGRVKATVHNPLTDENYAVEPFYVDGGAPPKPIFDLNQSGGLTIADNVDGNADGDITDSTDVAAVRKLPNGLISQNTIGRIANGVDAQFINYLVPPVSNEPCVGDCDEGFVGGHVDMDSDWYRDGDGVGGSAHTHTHEYDKIAGRVYVDYRDHGAAEGHIEIDDPASIPQGDQFIVVVANADMSPGAVLTLGDQQYNVVKYQAMIHKKLRSWAGKGSALTDDAGNSLIFSMADLVAADGTVRHDFTDQAIFAGGLHPTNPSCVIGGDFVTKGRYRNGTLVMQLINLDVFPACAGAGCALDSVIVQDPEDLPDEVLLGGEGRVAMKEDLDGNGEIDPGAYEVFGGIRGFASPADTDVLFESFIFWHYPGEACYGAAGWEADVAEARAGYGLTEAEWLQLVEDAGYGDKNLDEEYQRVLQCMGGADKAASKACKSELSVIEDLMAAREMIPDVVDDGLGFDGESPVSMGGDASDLGVTAGPNFQLGRRTWTDIFDE